MSNSTIHTRTDLRALADRAQLVHEGTDDPILRAQAEAVEDVLRIIVGDAPGTPLASAVTAGGIPA